MIYINPRQAVLTASLLAAICMPLSAQEQITIDFDHPLPPGVTLDFHVGCYGPGWEVNSGHANSIAVDNHAYIPTMCSQDSCASITLRNIDLTQKCRLRFDLHRPQYGTCSNGGRFYLTVDGGLHCFPADYSGPVEVDLSYTSGLQDLRFYYDGDNSSCGYGISIDNLVIGTDLDCNQNCVEDAVEIIQDPTVDSNANGVIDSCELVGPFWVRSPISRRLYAVLPPSVWMDIPALALTVEAVPLVVESYSLNSWLASTFAGSPIWIGLTDSAIEGTWAWTDSTPLLFHQWAPGEPADLDSSQDYAALNPATGEWRAWFAATQHRAIIQSVDIDCDNNLQQDNLDLALDPSLDCDGNGSMDACEVIDFPEIDCNLDGLIDECQLPDLALDCDLNGIIDSCSIASNPGLDCNSNGLLDQCETLMPEDDWNGDGLMDLCIPANYCEATVNSSGGTGRMHLSGTPITARNSLELSADGLPAQQWSYFLMSQATTFVPLFAGSQGNLCLGPTIIRINRAAQGEIGLTDLAGTRTLSVDLNSLPQGYTFLPGSTWHFQLWFRDINPGVTSNTSDGISILFR